MLHHQRRRYGSIDEQLRNRSHRTRHRRHGHRRGGYEQHLGFVGAGGSVSIYAYRVFPTPDDSCVNDNSSDDQCSSNTVDIADAIDDAVSQGVNVISMSLGGDACGTGSTFAPNGDSDITEGTAVANAIAHNVIVVAASGNRAVGRWSTGVRYERHRGRRNRAFGRRSESER